jgi:hypothetical protein
MGFDLYGKKAKTEKGEYFRNNVWWWRRLAKFVCERTGVVDDKDKEAWQYNDGHLVSSNEATQIAKQLRYLIKTGQVDKYQNEVEQERQKAELRNNKVKKLLDKLEKKAVELSGNADIAPFEYPSPLDEKWKKIYNMRDNNSDYPFTKDNVEEFIQFCEDSNGFTIC